MAIQQFYTPKKLLYPQNKFLATPLAYHRYKLNLSPRVVDAAAAVIPGIRVEDTPHTALGQGVLNNSYY